VTQTPSPRLRILGVDVDVMTPQTMIEETRAFIDRGGVAVIANHNAHSAYLFRNSPQLRLFYSRCERIQVDSTPILLWAKRLGLPLGRENRSTYLDWSELFWDHCTRNSWRVFHIGGAPGVPEAARDTILKRWPKVRLEVRNGYFDAAPQSEASQALRANIQTFDPDIILVGMGMPRQEQWIADNRDLLSRGVIFPTGAAFDYEAGVQTAAPRWMGRMGLEWLFRLISQPLRLGERYVIEPWFLLPAMWDDLQAARARRSSRKG
jgi:N-acetylglucosaminyldiphosphoundecaprenol N-acetyl-beta-D-mannosaminyltransferase